MEVTYLCRSLGPKLADPRPRLENNKGQITYIDILCDDFYGAYPIEIDIICKNTLFHCESYQNLSFQARNKPLIEEWRKKNTKDLGNSEKKTRAQQRSNNGENE